MRIIERNVQHIRESIIRKINRESCNLLTRWECRICRKKIGEQGPRKISLIKIKSYGRISGEFIEKKIKIGLMQGRIGAGKVRSRINTKEISRRELMIQLMPEWISTLIISILRILGPRPMLAAQGLLSWEQASQTVWLKTIAYNSTKPTRSHPQSESYPTQWFPTSCQGQFKRKINHRETGQKTVNLELNKMISKDLSYKSLRNDNTLLNQLSFGMKYGKDEFCISRFEIECQILCFIICIWYQLFFFLYDQVIFCITFFVFRICM